MTTDILTRWRLILGKEVDEECPLESETPLPDEGSKGCEGSDSAPGKDGDQSGKPDSELSEEYEGEDDDNRIQSGKGDKSGEGEASTSDSLDEQEEKAGSPDFSPDKGKSHKPAKQKDLKEIDDSLDFLFGENDGQSQKEPVAGFTDPDTIALEQYCEDQEFDEFGEEFDDIYEDEDGFIRGGKGKGRGTNPFIPDWFKRIKKFFPKDTVTFLQKEAIEKKGFKDLVLEPDVMASMDRNLDLLNLLLELKDHIPPAVRDTARKIIGEIVEDIEKQIRLEFEKTIMARPRRTETSLFGAQKNLNWKRTIKANCKNWIEEYQCIVPERNYYYGTSDKVLKGWTIIILLDQSGSMMDSIVFSTIVAGILASFKKMKTHLLLFDDNVVDCTDILDDPVDLLFNVRLGGGTSIDKAVCEGELYIHDPKKTIFILISDLFDIEDFARRLISIHKDGSRVLVLPALTDKNSTPSYDQNIAQQLIRAGIQCAITSPSNLVQVLDEIFQKGMSGG